MKEEEKKTTDVSEMSCRCVEYTLCDIKYRFDYPIGITNDICSPRSVTSGTGNINIAD